jgi:hypothetical protein
MPSPNPDPHRNKKKLISVPQDWIFESFLKRRQDREKFNMDRAQPRCKQTSEDQNQLSGEDCRIPIFLYSAFAYTSIRVFLGLTVRKGARPCRVKANGNPRMGIVFLSFFYRRKAGLNGSAAVCVAYYVAVQPALLREDFRKLWRPEVSIIFLNTCPSPSLKGLCHWTRIA